MNAGKGDKTRPYNPETFGKNYDNIFRKKNNMNEIIIEGLAKFEKHIFSRVRGELIWDALIPKVKQPEDSKKLEHTINENKTSEGYIKVKKKVFNYPNEIAHVRSPNIPMQAIDSAESCFECLGEAAEALLLSLKWMQHRRLEEAFERTSGGIIICDGTHQIKSFAHGDDVTSIDPSTITHGLTDGDLDAAWNQISYLTLGDETYGRSVGIPQHAFVTGLIDGLSTGNKPSHVDPKLDLVTFKTMGNMIHLDSFTPPRYTEVEGKLTRVELFKGNGHHNTKYDTAEFEVAYALHKSAMEYQVPSDDPENYLADLKWVAEKDDKGFILATMTGAMRPRNVGAAITMIFRRN